MADFEIAVMYVLENEDNRKPPLFGKVEIDNDGGQVRFGLNSKSFPELLDVINYYVNTNFYEAPVDVALAKAKSFYQTNQWKQISGDAIQSTPVATKILDMAVNMGVHEAIKLAQRAVNAEVDGIMGPLTISTINANDEAHVLEQLVYWWKWFINKEIANNPSDSRYKPNWEERAIKLPENTNA